MLRKLSISDFEDSKFGSNSEVLFTFTEDNIAYMYFGNTPVQVDYNTALYILHQKRLYATREFLARGFSCHHKSYQYYCCKKAPCF